MWGQESLLIRALVSLKEKQVCALKSIHAFWKHGDLGSCVLSS